MDVQLPGYRLVEPLTPGRARWPGGAAGAAKASGRAVAVWRGVRLADDEPVAIKLFDARDADCARREADLGYAVEHPNVLAPLEVVAGVAVEAVPEGGAPDGAACIGVVLPWAGGGDLAELVTARRRLRWPETLTVAIALADALAAAHERDIVHGDVSAGNVLFDDEGRPLLADLGAGRAAAEFGAPVAVTPTDVAPEIVRGALPAPASDLFSLGSVALRCLTGRPAWPARDLDDVLAQSAAGQWPDPEDHMAPAGLVALVRRLLDPEPGERGSAAGLAVELRDVGRPEPVALLERRADGTVLAPAPATVVRSDAVRPPRTAVPDGVARSWWRARAGAAGRWWRRIAVVGVVVILAVGAVRAGLWWAGWGRTDPTGALPAATTPATAASARPVAVTGASAEASAPVTGSAAPGTASYRRGPTEHPDGHLAQASREGVEASDPDWLAVVERLDAARSRALVQRDPSLLTQVYTAEAPGLSADAGQIATMRSSGYRVLDAAHRVRSASVVDLADDGAVTVRIVESLPAYQVYGAGGDVVGRTAEVDPETVLVHLVPAADGFRISQVRSP